MQVGCTTKQSAPRTFWWVPSDERCSGEVGYGPFDELVDGRVAKEPELERKRRSLFEPFGAEVLNQAQEAQRLADDLAGMALAAQLSFEDLARRWSHALRAHE